MKLTESQLASIVSGAIKKIINESGPNGMVPQDIQQDNVAQQPVAQPAAQPAGQLKSQLDTIINDKSKWPTDGKNAVRFVSKYQNYPRQGAGWLANMRNLTTNTEFIQTVRGLVNQYYGKKTPSNASANTGKAPAANQNTAGTASNSTAGNTANTSGTGETPAANSTNNQSVQYLDIRKMPSNLIRQYESYVNNYNFNPKNAAAKKSLDDFKKKNSQYLTNDSNFPNYEKLNKKQRDLLVKRLHQSRVNRNLIYNQNSKQDRIDQFNRTVQNLLESKVSQVTNEVLKRLFKNN